VKRVEHLHRDFAPNHWSGDDIITFPDIRDGIEALFNLFCTTAESADPKQISAPAIWLGRESIRC
jgi:hypothetical protein